ncbi:MAG: hypothetical protein Q8Q05_00995 [bacterium]|nr:hypothetical protein [bacterium]
MEFVYQLIAGVLGGTILGWFLGLLTPRILRKLRKSDYSILLNLELKNLVFRLASFRLVLCKFLGTIDSSTYNLIKYTLRKYNDGSIPDDVVHGFMNIQHSQYQSFLNHLSGLGEPNYFNLKKFPLVFLWINVDEVSVFDPAAQQVILSVITTLNILNEDVDRSMKLLDLTFAPGTTPENHQRISQNIKSMYENMATQAERLILKINDLLPAEAGDRAG